MPHKALGKSFRKGLSLIKFAEMFPNDKTAEKWFIEQRWPDGVTCPCCGSKNVQVRKTRKPQPYRCRDCRKDFSTKTGTLMEGSKLGFRVWITAIYLLSTYLKGISSMKLHRELEVTQKTAWYLAQRIRETWADNAGPFLGPAEVDETYIGGKRKNMSNAKRRQLQKEGAGRGSVGKTAVAGIKDRETNKVTTKMVANTDKETLQGFIRETVKPGATIYSAEAQAYTGMDDYHHEAVKHSVSEYVNGMAHVNGLESMWSMFKRGYHGTFHHVSPQHLHRYINEFAGRHNDCCSDTVDIMAHMAQGFEGKNLPYKKLVA